MIEVKSSQSELAPAEFIDQIQFGMWVADVERSVLVMYKLPQRTITVEPIMADRKWQAAFATHATSVYDTYLSWFHRDPIDEVVGRGVLHPLLQATELRKLIALS